MRKIRTLLALAFALLAAHSSLAQKLPAPARTVFKCEVQGKTVYSDETCLGAKRVDVEPTRGLNKSSGSERVGVDVQRERLNEQMAEALKPIFGESAEQRSKRHRRAKLSPGAQSQCRIIDQQIETTEATESRASRADRASNQARLLDLRTKFKELQC
jgi:hypothetical protein